MGFFSLCNIEAESVTFLERSRRQLTQVLRSRLQAFERENTRLENELAAQKDAGPPSKQSQQRQAELERVHAELQYAKQDFISSEDERKRLRLTLQKMQQEMEMLKAQPVEKPPPVVHVPEPEPKPASTPPPEQRPPQHEPAQPATRALGVHRSCDDPMNEDVLRQHVAILMGLAERWDYGCEKPKLALQAAVATFPSAVREAARAAAELLQEGLRRRHWTTLTAGATFLKHWFALFPLHVPEVAESGVKEQAKTSLLDALAAVLHSAVIDPAAAAAGCEEEEILHRETCALEVLSALQEIATKLPSALLTALAPALQQPSLFGMICEDPAPGSLHLPTLRLLEALMASPDLFTLAHQEETDENVLLAVANVLVIPSVPFQKDMGKEAFGDTLERQDCRVAALELLLRCLATAPSPDFVLQLRGAAQGEEVDTVLQRVALLCHHELLCLQLGARSPQRTRAVELSLFILSSWLWHAVPQASSLSTEQRRDIFRKLCNQLGKTRILLESIVEMVQALGSQQCFKSFLSNTSALRMLLPFVDDEPQEAPSSATASSSGPGTARTRGSSASVPVVVT